MVNKNLCLHLGSATQFGLGVGNVEVIGLIFVQIIIVIFSIVDNNISATNILYILSLSM